MKRVRSPNEKQTYYDILFPHIAPTLVDMITQNGRIPLENIVIIPRWKINGRDVFGQWQPFTSAQELIAFGQQKTPDSFQLGGIFEQTPTQEVRELNKRGVITATGPMVIDIDMNDYDRSLVCACGNEAKMCDVCYQTLLVPAQRILDYLLCEIYGFQQTFKVFSGKRGMHVWVLDKRCWEWTKEQRTSFIHSISVDSLSIRENPNIRKMLKNFDLEYPRFDLAVTADPCHLKKLPLMMHQDTRYLSILFPDLDSGYNFEMSYHCLKPNDIGLDMIKIFVDKIKNLLF